MIWDLFGIFLFVSIIIVFCAAVIAVIIYKSKKQNRRIFSPLRIVTLGTFLAGVIMFIPVYYSDASQTEIGSSGIHPLLLSIQNTFRIFFLNDDIGTVSTALVRAGRDSFKAYVVYASFIYVLAPILTFSNVLSLFKNINDEIRFAWHRKRPMYIFSELNERTIVMAKSVFSIKAKNRPVIVFTNILDTQCHEDYELLFQALELKAICLKKDMDKLKISNKKGIVEFFLMSSCDDDNVEQAVRLTELHKMRRNVSVFLYSDKSSAGYIIDSIDKGSETLDNSLTTLINENPIGFLMRDFNYDISVESSYYLRRLDPTEMLVRNTLKQEALVKHLFSFDKGCEKTVSIMILGLGKQGKMFLKTMLWLYQTLDCKLEITAFDLSRDRNGVPKSVIKELSHECPEIFIDPVKDNFSKNEPGESSYDVTILESVDVFTSDFDAYFNPTNENYTRISRTKYAIVCLGDDDANLKAAVDLRYKFDFIHIDNKKAEKNRINAFYNKNNAGGIEDEKQLTEGMKKEQVIIDAVVFDDTKASNFNVPENSSEVFKPRSVKLGLINYNMVPYNINIIGCLSDQYSYQHLEDQKKSIAADGSGGTEINALFHHLYWTRRDFLIKHKDRDILNGDSDIKSLNSELLISVENYVNYEYYRHSSIARADYEKVMKTVREVNQNNMPPTPTVQEHMRWNVYMRTIGYVHNGDRYYRALAHPDLVVYDSLSPEEKDKDEYYQNYMSKRNR